MLLNEFSCLGVLMELVGKIWCLCVLWGDFFYRNLIFTRFPVYFGNFFVSMRSHGSFLGKICCLRVLWCHNSGNLTFLRFSVYFFENIFILPSRLHFIGNLVSVRSLAIFLMKFRFMFTDS